MRGATRLPTRDGQFLIGGLQPGVYNLLFIDSPKGKMFVARLSKACASRLAKMRKPICKLTKERAIRGTAIDSVGNKPMAGAPILYYSLSHPRSGPACESTTSDEQGHLEMLCLRAGAVCTSGPGDLSGVATRRT